MKTITFHNNTFLDSKAFQIMGLSVKEDDAIGLFGTGFKYAIATAMRHGDKVEIQSAGETFRFDTKESEFRGEKVDLITCNGKELGFTTQLGKLWKPWMAYREFYANARDEGGGVTTGECNAMTQIRVTGEAMTEAHGKRDEYFLIDQSPIFESEDFEIFRNPTSRLFYKGIAVGDIDPIPFHFNLKFNVTLTEDRTIANTWTVLYEIGSGIARMKNKALIKELLANSFFSDRVDYCSAKDYSPEFMEVVHAAFLQHGVKGIPNGFKSIYAKSGKHERQKLELTERQTRQIKKAKSFLKTAGYELEHPVYLIESEGDSLFGQAADGEIHLTQKAFEHGTFELAATLLEEHAHLTTGHHDFDRKLQDWMLRQIILQAERATDDIL